MRKYSLLLSLCMALLCIEAWAIWPFGSGDSSKKDTKRVSELIEKASDLIDTASDMAATGAVSQAVLTYRAALEELSNVEKAHPDRAQTAEFSTLRNKRAYVEAAITSLQFEETRRNAKPVAVSNTTELERKLAEERRIERLAKAPPRERARLKALECLAAGNLKDALRISDALYGSNTNDVMALNLRAAVLAANKRTEEARPLLERAIQLAPMDYSAYYNMARLLMQISPANKESARSYFADGCALGGPKNPKLEALLK